MPAQRLRNPKTWHIATLAPGLDNTRLRFPILVATDDSSSKTLMSSQSELDTLLKTHYGDAASDIPTTTSSSPQRKDSVVDLSTPSEKSPSNPFTDDYLTPLSSHFVDGELCFRLFRFFRFLRLRQMAEKGRD
ncbi:uncharacterized protein J4E79_002840 [Alternaria viburni]|uniref:uncharacterized protein n=1 Tax=Alternaria viburni TaxID=566460 RepID=UPI0020C4D5DB|nr:uncharacterized protein J4E79_002840 [Alternaria viburni]KAI4666800.1 hypothetical protein J4E79_002840 [Alternaria viburni]